MLAPGSTIGFIGTGVMGSSMAGHLLDAGYALRIFNRSPGKTGQLVEKGAAWCGTPAAAADGADAVVTMVGYPSDVEDLYLGGGGLVEAARPGTLLIDMTTSSPGLAVRIHAAAGGRGVRALDAPVSGGDVGAREARLTIMVGGDADAFADAEPMFRVMGPNVVLQGGPGAGQNTKMSNQLAIAGCMIGVCEALAYAEAAGLDPERVLASIGAGSAASWSLANYAPRMLAGDFAPGFYVKHFIKDLRIAAASADELGIDIPGAALALRLYERLAERGGADFGTHALYLLYKEHAAGAV
jgi:3-hydroxyisobutyrate dehydrogenase